MFFDKTYDIICLFFNYTYFERDDILELKWMSKHRSLVEQLIKYGNTYANTYRLQRDYGIGVNLSASQIQTLEYILENEERGEKMTQMAKRLGVTTSTFSKNTKKLMEKELLEKYQYTDNKKDIYIKVTDKGRKIYLEYSKYINENCFSEIFKIADTLSNEEIKKFEKILGIFSETLILYQKPKNSNRTLIKVSSKKRNNGDMYNS